MPYVDDRFFGEVCDMLAHQVLPITEVWHGNWLTFCKKENTICTM